MLGRVFRGWLSGAVYTAMVPEQDWDSAEPADAGINVTNELDNIAI